MEQAVWRSVMDLKQRIREAESVEAVTAIEEAGEETLELETTSKSELDELVRAEFDLPEALDSDAEAHFSTVVDHLLEDDLEAARATVDDAFTTPCEEVDPQLTNTGGSHDIACLLYDGYGDRSEMTWADGTDNVAADD